MPEMQAFFFRDHSNFERHKSICDGNLVNHIWKGGVDNLKINIKKRLEAFDFDTSKHDFLFPHLTVYDTEVSLPAAMIQPAGKR